MTTGSDTETPARITTVIPTYRRPALVVRAIESVLSQSYPHLEVVVTDNASGDETRAVVEAIAARDPRVRYFEHPANQGATKNFRFGWGQVRTRWMSFLSDDDFLLPGFFETAIERLEANPAAEFFCGQTVIYDERRGSHRLQPTGEWTSRLYGPGEATLLMARAGFIWTSCVFSMDVCRALGEFDDTAFPDISFVIQAAARHAFVTTMKPGAVFVNWDAGFSHASAAGGFDALDRYASTLRQLRDDPAIDAATLGFLEAHFKTVGTDLLAWHLKRAFLDGRWEDVDRLAATLEERGPVKSRVRRVIDLSRRRQRNPLLVRSVRMWQSTERRWRSFWKRRRLERMTLEEVTALHAIEVPAGADEEA